LQSFFPLPLARPFLLGGKLDEEAHIKVPGWQHLGAGRMTSGSWLVHQLLGEVDLTAPQLCRMSYKRHLQSCKHSHLSTGLEQLTRSHRDTRLGGSQNNENDDKVSAPPRLERG